LRVLAVCKVDSKAPGIRSLGFRVPTVCKVDSKAPGIRSLGFRVPTVCKVGSKAPGIRSYTSIFRFKDGVKSSMFRVWDDFKLHIQSSGSRVKVLRFTVYCTKGQSIAIYGLLYLNTVYVSCTRLKTVYVSRPMVDSGVFGFLGRHTAHFLWLES
jgi:hypothetical protein